MAEWRRVESDLTTQVTTLRRTVTDLEHKLAATATLALEREQELEALATAQAQEIARLKQLHSSSSASAAETAASLHARLQDSSEAHNAALAAAVRRAEALEARVAELLGERHRFEARLEAAGIDVVSAAPFSPATATAAGEDGGSGEGWSGALGDARAGTKTPAYGAHEEVR